MDDARSVLVSQLLWIFLEGDGHLLFRNHDEYPKSD